jgi:DNA-binding MarR family transcriptional regulator
MATAGSATALEGVTPDGSELPAGLRMVIARLHRMLRQTSAGAELSPTQYQVLATTFRQGTIRLSDLAAEEGLNPTMLSRIAAKLEGDGLVNRTQDLRDGRVAHLEISEAGRRLVLQVRRERTDALSAAVASLSEGDQRALTEALPVLEALAEAVRDTRP